MLHTNQLHLPSHKTKRTIWLTHHAKCPYHPARSRNHIDRQYRLANQKPKRTNQANRPLRPLTRSNTKTNHAIQSSHTNSNNPNVALNSFGNRHPQPTLAGSGSQQDSEPTIRGTCRYVFDAHAPACRCLARELITYARAVTSGKYRPRVSPRGSAVTSTTGIYLLSATSTRGAGQLARMRAASNIMNTFCAMLRWQLAEVVGTTRLTKETDIAIAVQTEVHSVVKKKITRGFTRRVPKFIARCSGFESLPSQSGDASSNDDTRNDASRRHPETTAHPGASGRITAALTSPRGRSCRQLKPVHLYTEVAAPLMWAYQFSDWLREVLGSSPAYCRLTVTRRSLTKAIQTCCWPETLFCWSSRYNKCYTHFCLLVKGESNALLILTTSITEDTLETVMRFSTDREGLMELHRLFGRGSEDKVYDVNCIKWVEDSKPLLLMENSDGSQLEESVGAVEGLMTATASLTSDNDGYGWYIKLMRKKKKNNEDPDSVQHELGGDEEKEH
ncbi:hypothetical protein PR048_020230 [Dryococelus australis]|uniref:Uncharacterized protein n=1 Tax=Dryococelus australis TaxID=614101 RepID=A0ABQ9H5Q8_9NEOP|nr:hypothetical protein PR048_020230 [Dryococelus australis]